MSAPPEGRADAVAGKTVEAPRREEGSGAPAPAAEEGGAPVEDPTQAIINDPIVKRAVELFGGRIAHVEPRKKEG